jgi:hypothetical protein
VILLSHAGEHHHRGRAVHVFADGSEEL